MSKVSRYNSIQALKANAKATASTVAVVADRHAKFEGFISSLKGDSMATGVSVRKQKAKSKGNGYGS
ncbi:hypothetical protein [Fibrella arboris]|uniref:hypothetical protein n=1 Tax=Fibrella arboris TaxID=3242486 RepID=UPI0035209DF1